MTHPIGQGFKEVGKLSRRVALSSLILREVSRFVSVTGQTIFAPALSSLMLLLVFSLALASLRPSHGEIPLLVFIAPGLVMLGIQQNSFQNTSWSLLIAKVSGNIADLLMPPLSPAEFVIGFAIGAMLRGLAVGILTAFAVYFIAPWSVHSIWAIVFYPLIAALILALAGMIAGVWAERIDQLSTVTNFVLNPLTFLSGVFYSINQLPSALKVINLFNPIFYMIDGMRYSMTGYHDASIMVGSIYLIGVALITFICTYFIVASGWKMKP